MSRTDELNVIFQSAFPTNKVEMKDETLKAIKDIFYAVGEKVDEDELKPVIEYMLKTNEEALKSNNEWAGSMSARKHQRCQCIPWQGRRAQEHNHQGSRRLHAPRCLPRTTTG